MTNDPIYLLKPVFNFLDHLIRDEGDRLYVVFGYVCLFVIAWILRGGLRRRLSRPNSRVTIPIIVILPSVQPPPLPPIIGEQPERGQRPSADRGGTSFAA
jgi:hypothetical protein